MIDDGDYTGSPGVVAHSFTRKESVSVCGFWCGYFFHAVVAFGLLPKIWEVTGTNGPCVVHVRSKWLRHSEAEGTLKP